MEQKECSETSAYKIQTQGNYPREIMQHSEQGESLKLRILLFCHINDAYFYACQLHVSTTALGSTELYKGNCLNKSYGRDFDLTKNTYINYTCILFVKSLSRP
jgi:hypothetical protein